MIYWCDNCKIPIQTLEKNICPLCEKPLNRALNNQVNPVFAQERKFISLILNEDITESSVWNLGGAYYLIDGYKKHVPYTQFLKNKGYKHITDDFFEINDSDIQLPDKDKFLKAHSEHIEELAFEAEQYIKQTYEKYANQCIPIISFSGGKDSTVISSLVQNALQRKDVLHFMGDTTLEFPFTEKYCNEVFRENNPFTPLIISKPDKDFFSICEELGPPSRRERWCCTIFKTSNINTLIQSLPDGMNSLTFTGIRRSESTARKNYPRTRIQSKISRQIVAMPIIEWSDLDVWLYILQKDLSFNEAYKLGYRRVGCWCCPNNSMWSDLLNAVYLPDQYRKWQEFLYKFAVKTNKQDIDDYIDNGRWRSRIGASGLPARNNEIRDFECFSNDISRNIVSDVQITNDFLEFLKPFGRLLVTSLADKQQIEIYDNNNTIVAKLEVKLGSKLIKVRVGKGYDYLTFIKRLKCQLRKYQYCIYCGACEAVCSQSAIKTTGGIYSINDNKCIHCKECIAHYYNGCITTEVLSNKKGGLGQ